jgi:large subunit ribosomal protein L17
MRKRKKGRKLSRKRDQRRALLKSLMRELFLKEKIVTTLAKAKEMRPLAEKIITKAKKGDLKTLRYLRKRFAKDVCFKLIKEIGPRYLSREGGYLRILKLGERKGDRAKMAQIELIKQ